MCVGAPSPRLKQGAQYPVRFSRHTHASYAQRVPTSIFLAQVRILDSGAQARCTSAVRLLGQSPKIHHVWLPLRAAMQLTIIVRIRPALRTPSIPLPLQAALRLLRAIPPLRFVGVNSRLFIPGTSATRAKIVKRLKPELQHNGNPLPLQSNVPLVPNAMLGRVNWRLIGKLWRPSKCGRALRLLRGSSVRHLRYKDLRTYTIYCTRQTPLRRARTRINQRLRRLNVSVQVNNRLIPSRRFMSN